MVQCLETAPDVEKLPIAYRLRFGRPRNFYVLWLCRAVKSLSLVISPPKSSIMSLFLYFLNEKIYQKILKAFIKIF